MPIAGWICAGCSGRRVDLNHFETTQCGATVCHPDYIAAVLASNWKPRPGIHVSSGLGCPRSTAIEQSEQYYVNPLDLNAMETGTAWHAHVEKHTTEPANAEVEVKGIIDG